MDEWARGIETRLAALETRKAVDEVHQLNVQTRLGNIEDVLKWLVRLIIGTMTMAVLAYALKDGLSI
ncbi:MAG: pseudouridine synthase [Limimaricola sp.]|uniref:pseudouridine synthase n=1 Tax=Limimaricola sp. TaxID=2211665 RepID=UPI001DFBEAAA|nr:pseudouridine synthase [Limimaricola sp.]MBI1416703.1 pseudouridine synthase [Limimaricola sp.]